MKRWVILAFFVVIVLAYLLFFTLDSLDNRGSNALGLANTVGLATVAIGIVVAAVVLRRTSRP